MIDQLYHITKDAVVYPMTSIGNTKAILFKDIHGRHWQMIPTTNPAVMMPFIVKPLSEEKFNELKMEER